MRSLVRSATIAPPPLPLFSPSPSLSSALNSAAVGGQLNKRHKEKCRESASMLCCPRSPHLTSPLCLPRSPSPPSAF
uniref:Uncharacterized protein n=1 Tax=Leishmania guyanensis TaxID=5670 RepID=A0A1E1IPZ2_LEIGU|nr:Hypothetical protein BN36_0807310 [Leishmania guyanensis]